MEKLLKKTRQCSKCPWHKNVNPCLIPDGYNIEKHKALKDTIAYKSPVEQLNDLDKSLKVMACHETNDDYCIGWLHNQLGIGNNVRLRIQMMDYTNADRIEVIGEQHQCFEDTLPIV